MKLLDAIRKQLRPKKIPNVVKHLAAIDKALKTVEPIIDIQPGGSFAKGTFNRLFYGI